MRWGQWEVPDATHRTTAWLSHRRRMRRVDQLWPEATAASTMGYSSFHWMLCCSCAWVHRPLNHCPWQ